MAYADTNNDGQDINMKAVIGQLWRRRYRILLITFILSALAFVLLLFMPKIYESSASLLVEPRDNVFLRATNDPGGRAPGIADDVLMSSQVELIKSSQTLIRVVRSEGLVDISEFNGTKPSVLDPLFALLGRSANQDNIEQKVLARLSKSITVIRERNSRVISILMRSEDPALAARIANALASAHVSRRAELSINDTVDATQWLSTEIDKLRIRVVDSEAAVARFRIDNDLFVGTNATSLVDQQLSNIVLQITTAQERGNTARSRANLINGLLRSGQPIDGIGDVQSSVVIQRLSEEKARLQGDRAQLLATLLPNHPQIISISAQISEVDQQILAEGRRVAGALEAEAQIEEALTATLRDDLTRLKVSASNAATSSVQLQELEREAKSQRDLLETYLARYRDASARTDTGAELPDVRVISFALPALTATSPKTSLVLVAVAIVSITVQMGAVLFSELATVAPTNSRASGTQNTSVAPDEQNLVLAMSKDQGLDQEPVFGSASLENNEEVPKSPEPEIKSEPEQNPARAAALNISRPDKNNENISALGAQLSTLASSLMSGEQNTVILAALDRRGDSGAIGEFLLEEATANGMSVAVIDAESGVVSQNPGISDLSAGDVEFGDVVFSPGQGDLTEVYWGTLAKIVPHSERPKTLIEALADICDIVIVFAEPVGIASSLPVFAGVDATLILVAGTNVEQLEAEAISRDATALGFERSIVLEASKRASNVA